MKKGNFALSFLAQRLDNQELDHMELDQCPLAEEDVDERQELDSQIAKVSLDGSQVFTKGYHAAFLLDDKFLLETPSDQSDDAERVAPIITYGCIPNDPPESWSGDVIEALTTFAGSIDRTICKKNAKVAQSAMDAVLKKKQHDSIRRKVLWTAVVAIVLVVICIIYWIVSKED